MRDVRINKDVPVAPHAPTCKMKQSNELLDFRNKKIPPIIIKCVQVYAQLRLRFQVTFFYVLYNLLHRLYVYG